MSIVFFAIQIIPQVFASSVLYYSIKESFLTILNSVKITNYWMLNIKIYSNEINNCKISKQRKLPMGNASASQVNVRSFKVIDPLDTVYQYLFLLVAKMTQWLWLGSHGESSPQTRCLLRNRSWRLVVWWQLMARMMIWSNLRG